MSLTVLDKASLILDGRAVVGAHTDLFKALREVKVRETITGASTCTLSVVDGKGVIRNSGPLAKGVTAVIDGVGFELVRVGRAADGGLELEMEDMAVAALRRRNSYRKVAAGAMSRAAFCQLLIREEPWITVSAAPGAVSKVELARGSASSSTTTQAAGGTTAGGIGNYGLDPDAGAAVKTNLTVSKAKSTTTKTETEDTWDACARIMGEINWRVFSSRKTITIAPDSWIMSRGTAYPMSASTAGVEEITWDYDTGQPAATANLKVRCGTTLALPVGSRVTLTGEGPANGDWLAESIERTDRSAVADVSLIRPEAVLPEPDASTASLSDLANFGEGGWPSSLAELEALLAGLGGAPKGTGAASSSALVEAFVQLALAQAGKRYVFGDTGPDTFDCSGLVMWCAAHVGANPADRDANDRGGQKKNNIPYFGRNVAAQLALCRRAGTLMSVEGAIATRGALLIRGPNGHIAISLGNGKTMEAKGRAYGVNVFEARGRGWTTGAWVPGITVSQARSGAAS